jgi:preprotein translocase subunit SecG
VAIIGPVTNGKTPKMQNVLLVIHLILALCLIGVVLLQRSEGGGLGIGGGGGGAMSGRGMATALSKMTWIFASAFLVTSISLTILAASNANSDSVIERLGTAVTSEVPAPAPASTDLAPPVGGDTPAAPPKAAD